MPHGALLIVFGCSDFQGNLSVHLGYLQIGIIRDADSKYWVGLYVKFPKELLLVIETAYPNYGKRSTAVFVMQDNATACNGGCHDLLSHRSKIFVKGQ